MPADSGSGAIRPGDVAGLVHRNLDLFEQASRLHGERVADVDVVGRRVRVRMAGAALGGVLLGALRHRQLSPDGRPELTICAWDGKSTGSRAAAAGVPAARGAHDARTLARGDGVFLAFQGTEPWAAQGYDAALRAAFLWVSDADAVVRGGERTKPFLEILHSWLLDTPWQPVHAAAVGGSGGGVVLAGRGGSGKSTTALACVRAGWRYAGDDYILISAAPEPRAENLYASARLRVDMAERLVDFRLAHVGSVTMNGIEKHDLLLSGLLPASRIGGFPVRAVLLPRVARAPRSALRPASAAQAMIALSSTTMHFLRTGSAASFERMGRFVSEVPAYWLDLGEDLDALPRLIAGEIGAGPG